MATHRFAPRVTWNTMAAHLPVLRIADGDRVVAETLDAHGFDKAGKQPCIWHRIEAPAA